MKSLTGITNLVFRFFKWFVLTVAIKKRLQLHFTCQWLENTELSPEFERNLKLSVKEILVAVSICLAFFMYLIN